MLKITYYGQTSFVLESDESSVLLNPGIWNGESVVPDDVEVRVIIATNHLDEAVGNATMIAANSKAWILGNRETIDKVKNQGGKPWLLHVLKPEVPYEIPGLKVVPFPLRKGVENGERIENLGLYIDIGGMKVSYLGDSLVRGPFGQLEAQVVITPIGGDGVLSVKDATNLCIDAKANLGIPMRWTTSDQPSKFAKYIDQFAQGCAPVVMEKGQSVQLQWAAGHEFRYELT